MLLAASLVRILFGGSQFRRFGTVSLLCVGGWLACILGPSIHAGAAVRAHADHPESDQVPHAPCIATSS